MGSSRSWATHRPSTFAVWSSRRVEHVDVRAHRAAERLRKGRLALEVGERGEPLLERLQPLRLDARLVHEGREVVADEQRARVALRLTDLADQLCRALVGELGDLCADAPAAAVLRDLGPVEPRAVGIAEEVDARRHGRIHSVTDRAGLRVLPASSGVHLDARLRARGRGRGDGRGRRSGRRARGGRARGHEEERERDGTNTHPASIDSPRPGVNAPGNAVVSKRYGFDARRGSPRAAGRFRPCS